VDISVAVSPTFGTGTLIPRSKSWKRPDPHAAIAEIPKVIPINREVVIIPAAVPLIASLPESTAVTVTGAIINPKPSPAIIKCMLIRGSLMFWSQYCISRRAVPHIARADIDGILRSSFLVNIPPRTAPTGMAIVRRERINPPSIGDFIKTVFAINGIVTSAIIKAAP
ncbi:uncharacterized protein METZ01_LOCUS231809, partial [marine metagenome]